MSYRPPPETKKPLSVRLPSSLVSKLDEVVAIWKMQAAARQEAGMTDNPENIDRSHVISAFIEKSVEDEFALYGGRPSDPAAWDRVRAQVKASVATVSGKNTKK